MNKHINEYLNSLDKTCLELKGLDAHKIDSKVKYLKIAFNIAYKNGVFQLYKYTLEEQDILKLKLFEKLTKFSGSLSFLAIQILAANSIMNKNNFKRKEFYFEKKCGIAINHLRSPSSIVYAKQYKNGYLLNGTFTWASGYKIFDRLLIGFHYDNKEFEVLAKFKEDSTFKIIDTPLTFVGKSLNTVSVKLENFYVKEKNIVSSNEIGNYTKNKSLSKTVHYALYGLGVASVKHIKDEDFKKHSKKRLKKIKKRFIDTTNGIVLDELRIELFNIIQKIITTAMILNGGKSILTEQHLQRYYRELIMFNSNGLNTNIKELFLDDFIIKNY